MASIKERLDHRLERKARYDRQALRERTDLRLLHQEIDEIVRGAREALKWED